jgi:PAS domain S-box-containing protein
VSFAETIASLLGSHGRRPRTEEGKGVAEIERVRGAEDLRRDAILEAVAFAAERFLLVSDWRQVAPEVLARLGIAAGASRSYIFENVTDPLGHSSTRLVGEWTAPGIEPQIENPELHSTNWEDSGLGRWAEAMERGESISGPVRSFPSSEWPILETQQIRSLAAFPVFAGRQWWGLVGLDDCVSDRRWTKNEIDALRAASSVLGAAVQRRRSDDQVRAAEHRYRALVERLPAVTYLEAVAGEDGGMGRILYISPQVEKVLGYPPELWTSDRSFWRRILHPDDGAWFDEVVTRSNADLEPTSQDFRMIAADGHEVWLHDEAVLIRDEHGVPQFWQGFFSDVTERRHAEEQARVAEERFRMIVERTPAITYQEVTDETYDPGSTLIYVSPQIERILGYPAELWSENPGFWLSVTHPDDRKAVLDEGGRTVMSGEPYRQDYRMIASDGRIVWFHDESILIHGDAGGPLMWQGVMVDVTEQKQAEERLRHAEERYRILVEHIPAVVYVESMDGSAEQFYISPQVREVFGYDPEVWRWTDDFWSDRVHPDDVERVLAVDAATNDNGDDYSIEYRFRTADGRWAWVHDEAVFVAQPGGPGFWQGFLMDITERRESEERLREAEEKFRTIVEQNQAIFYTQEIDAVTGLSRTNYIAPGNTDLIGYTTDEVLADPELWWKIVHPDDRARVLEADRDSNVGGSGDRFSLEYRVVRKDGHVVWVQDEARLVRIGEAPPYWQGFLLEITERKEAEERLADALEREREATQRLRSLDEMKNTFLQAVSHDLRTPLAAILGLAITLERPDVHLEEADAHDLARRIAENARKLDRLVTNLLDLDRLARGIVEPKLHVTDLGALVRRALSESDLIADSRVHTEIAEVVLPIDGAKVERIVENLLANTIRHTPEGTTVDVRVVRVPEGGMIVVEDDGPGVAEDLRETIFEPFLQGPDAPQHSPGVGVGLALVRRFAELHGGSAWVEDREGGGASFRVLLPASRGWVGGARQVDRTGQVDGTGQVGGAEQAGRG